MSIASTSVKEEESKPNVLVPNSDSLPSEMSGTEDEDEADKFVKLQNQYVLGMLSRNRELFLFDR